MSCTSVQIDKKNTLVRFDCVNIFCQSEYVHSIKINFFKIVNGNQAK